MAELISAKELLRQLGWGRLSLLQYGTMRRAGFSKAETEAADYDCYQQLRAEGLLTSNNRKDRQAPALERQAQYLLANNINPEGLSYIKARCLVDHTIKTTEDDKRFMEFLEMQEKERDRKAREKRTQRARVTDASPDRNQEGSEPSPSVVQAVVEVSDVSLSVSNDSANVAIVEDDDDEEDRQQFVADLKRRAASPNGRHSGLVVTHGVK